MTQTGTYTVNAQGIVEHAQNHVDPERGIRMLEQTFGMPREVAEKLYYGNIEAICDGDTIVELRYK
jgi:hypothetical protein